MASSSNSVWTTSWPARGPSRRQSKVAMTRTRQLAGTGCRGITQSRAVPSNWCLAYFPKTQSFLPLSCKMLSSISEPISVQFETALLAVGRFENPVGVIM